MKILVLGANGYIGSLTLNKLFQSYGNKIIIHGLSKNNLNNKNLENKIKFYKFDLENDSFKNLIIEHSYDIIINCLSSKLYQNLKINIIYDFFMPKLKDFKNSKWIEISTLSVYPYGKNIYNYFPEKMDFSKDLKITSYGSDKIIGEKYLINNFNYNIIILRVAALVEDEKFNVFLFNIFKKFIIFNFFINFYNKNESIKITTADMFFSLLNKFFNTKLYDNTACIAFEKINPLDSIKSTFYDINKKKIKFINIRISVRVLLIFMQLNLSKKLNDKILIFLNLFSNKYIYSNKKLLKFYKIK